MNINASSIPNPNNQYKPTRSEELDSPFVSFMKKIWNAVKEIFRKIGEWFKKIFCKKKDFFDLTDDEVNMIQNAHRYQAPPNEIEMTDLSTRDITPVEVSRTGAAPEIPPEMTRFPPIEDPVMKEFNETSKKFIEEVLSCVFEEKIQNSIGNVSQGLGQFSKGLKFAADLAVKMGDKVSKPLFEKLKSYKINALLDPDFEQLLKWLITDVEKIDFKNKLDERLKDNKQLSGPCVDWVFKSEHSQSLASAYGPEQNSEEIDTVFEATLVLLLEIKIDSFISKCNDKLNDKLADILKDSLKKNGQKIADIITRRFIDVIKLTEYPQMFDNIIGVTYDQTNAVLAVDKAQSKEEKNQKALIKKARRAEGQECKNEEERVRKGELLDLIEKVDEVGEEAWIEQRVEEAGLNAYAEYQICTPEIAQLMTNKNLSPEQKSKIKENLFDNLAEKIIPILIPNEMVQTPDGEVHEIDGIIALCNEIDIPSEFTDLTSECKDIAEQILTEKTQDIIRTFYNVLKERAGNEIQNIILEQVRKYTKRGLKIGAKALFETFITPNLINDLFGRELLPSIQKQILISMGLNRINKNESKYVEQFNQLVKAENPESAREQLLKTLYEEVKDSIKEFEVPSLTEYNEIMLPTIQSIESGIKLYQNKKKTQSEESVRVAIKGYFKQSHIDINPLYGDLIESLVFKLGDFGSFTNLVFDLFKGSVSRVISEAVHKASSSPHFFVESATNQMKKRFLDLNEEESRAAMKELIFGQKNEPSQEGVDEKLSDEIKKTSQILYDLIIANGKWEWAVKKVLGSDHNYLNKVISRVYKKMFFNRHITHNLIIRVQDVMINALSEASHLADFQNQLNVRKVQKIPTVIPNIFGRPSNDNVE